MHALAALARAPSIPWQLPDDPSLPRNHDVPVVVEGDLPILEQQPDRALERFLAHAELGPNLRRARVIADPQSRVRTQRFPNTLGVVGSFVDPAERMIQAVNATIPDERNHFVREPVFIPGSSVFAASRFLQVACVVQETTRVGRDLSLRAHQHQIMTRRLLADIGMTIQAS